MCNRLEVKRYYLNVSVRFYIKSLYPHVWSVYCNERLSLRGIRPLRTFDF